jgi:AhpD family alkylhydroperoxidase
MNRFIAEWLLICHRLDKSTEAGEVPYVTRKLIHLRASQINACSVCVDMHARELKKAGEKDERIFAVAAWRETPYFTAPERAALALAEAATRLADRSDAVPDDVWEEAARHYDDKALAALVIQIALINAFNRLNAGHGSQWAHGAERAVRRSPDERSTIVLPAIIVSGWCSWRLVRPGRSPAA